MLTVRVRGAGGVVEVVWAAPYTQSVLVLLDTFGPAPGTALHDDAYASLRS